MKIFSKFSLKIQKTFSRSPVKEGGRNPYVDWMMILTVSVLIVVTLVINSIYLLRRIDKGNLQNTDTVISNATDIFDSKALNDFIDRLNSRVEITKEIKKDFRFVADPSI